MTKEKSKPKILRIISAGGVVLSSLTEFKVYLILPSGKQKSYTWPKGKQDSNETLPNTALREVQEESGIQARILYFLGSWNYKSHLGPDKKTWYPKTAHYYLMLKTGGNKNDHDNETSQVVLASYDEARKLIKNKRDLAILIKAKQVFDKYFLKNKKKKEKKNGLEIHPSKQ